MSEWIAVEQKLPPRGQYVLWAQKDNRNFLDRVVEGYYDPWPNGMQFWRATRAPSTPLSLTEVTAWQHLPAPPETESRKP